MLKKRSLIVIVRSSSEHLSGETQLEMSLSTAWRHRRSEAEHLAATEISSFMEAVQESATRILVQFDEKDLEQDIDGKVIEIENQSLKEPARQVLKQIRLVVVFTSPWLNREQLISAIPLEGKTG